MKTWRFEQRRNLIGSLAVPVGLGLLAAALSGCTMVTWTGPGGERFSRGSIGASTSLSALSVETGTNGIRRIEVRGYQNENSQALGTVTEAAVKAAIQGGK